MSNIEAAIGCAQLERVDELIAAKRRIFEAYRERLRDMPLTMNPEPSGCVNGYWMPTVVVDRDVPFDREALLTAFGAEEIDGRSFFWPLSRLPMYEPRPDHRVANGLCERAVNLPSYHDLSASDIDRVCAVVRAAVQAGATS